MKLVLIVSSGGAIMNECLKNGFFKSQVHSVVSDRQCPAIDKATAHGIDTVVLETRRKAEFCDRLLTYLDDNGIDFVISFYTKLFVGPLLERYRDKIINLHPGLLPSFKGLHGFEDTMQSGTTFLGSTIHFIDAQMDEGKTIIQTIHPIDRAKGENALRHMVFVHEVKSLLQVVKWLSDGRVKIDGSRVSIDGGRYELTEYSPNLDWDEAIAHAVPEYNAA